MHAASDYESDVTGLAKDIKVADSGPVHVIHDFHAHCSPLAAPVGLKVNSLLPLKCQLLPESTCIYITS